MAMQERCLEECPELDAVATGEGEFTVAKMLERVAARQPLGGVLGVAYRDGERIIAGYVPGLPATTL